MRELPAANAYAPTNSGICWSLDGRFLVVPGRLVSKEGGSGLYSVINIKTGEAQPLVLGEPTTRLLDPNLSPDGKTIFSVFSAKQGEKRGVLVRNLERAEERVLYQAGKNSLILGLVLSPDGHRLAFGLGKGYVSTSYVGDSTLLNQRLTFGLGKGDGSGALMVMSASGGEPRELFRVNDPSILEARGFAWSHDGRHLLSFARTPNKDGLYDLWRIAAEGGEPQKLGEVAMEGVGGLRVSPDGRRIAFSAGRVGKREIWVMENFLPALKASR